MIRFTKMHGLSNDFVVIDGPSDLGPDAIRALCDRRTGIGADGVLAVTSARGEAAVEMQYWNADGSTAEMCGNGLRCVSQYAMDNGLVDESSFTVATPAGPKSVVVHTPGDVSVDLGPVRVHSDHLTLHGRNWTQIDVGNPHVVTFVDDPNEIAVTSEGPTVETDPAFPNGTNVEYVSVDGGTINMRVWERGVGETLACGTGMVAAAAATRERQSGDSWAVTVRGGTGTVRFERDHVWLRGPAVTVFSGEWALG